MEAAKLTDTATLYFRALYHKNNGRKIIIIDRFFNVIYSLSLWLLYNEIFSIKLILIIIVYS